ncbi:FecR domain-containing protein, partial [Chloroflexota bacterium]
MKKSSFQIILEQCIEQLQKGSSLEDCLSQYPEHREKLEPLLRTAFRLNALEETKPSDEFITASKARVLNRIREVPVESRTARQRQNSLLDTLSNLVRDFIRYPVSLRRYAVPVAVALIIVAVVSVGQLFYFRPSTSLAAPCTLNVFTGNVEIREPGTDEWQYGTNRMVLEAGTVIKTQESSHAILTFFTGSASIKLEPATELVIQQLDNGDGAKTITLTQNTGKTWSFVGPSESPETMYKVDTPSASALAAGTLFTVEVDDDGATTVVTTEGKVKVKAQDSEVLLSSMQKVKVKRGEAVPAPSSIFPPGTEIIISADSGVAASITDPSGSSTGNLESGFSYNQITGSQSIVYSDGPQIITIPEPVSGQYILLLSCEAPGTNKFSIKITSDDKEVVKYSVSLPENEQQLWLIHLNISVSNGVVENAEVGEIEVLKNKDIDDVVTVSPSIAEQEKAKSESEKKKDKEQDKKDKENKGRDNEGEDEEDRDGQSQGKPDDKEDKDNKGQD